MELLLENNPEFPSGPDSGDMIEVPIKLSCFLSSISFTTSTQKAALQDQSCASLKLFFYDPYLK